MEERLTAMVPTPAGARLSAAEVARALGEFAGPLGAPQVAEAQIPDANSFLVTLAGVTVTAIKFGFPIPDETLARALHYELLWRDAASALKAAKGHVLLAVMNTGSDPRRMTHQARVLTAVTAAVLTSASGIGVFWSPADYVIPPDRFKEEAADLRKSEFASPLWFSFRFFPGSADANDESLVCQSTALEIFLGREIECGPYRMPPGDLAKTVLAVARYMATAGAIFGDGHTLGFGEGGKSNDARLRLRSSARSGIERKVFGLELAAQEALVR
jgi:hypothetical protein